jgi:flagellar hook-length control protein FliK
MEITSTNAMPGSPTPGSSSQKHAYGSPTNSSAFAELLNQVAPAEEKSKQAATPRSVRETEQKPARHESAPVSGSAREKLQHTAHPSSRVSGKAKAGRAEKKASSADPAQKTAEQPAADPISGQAAVVSNPSAEPRSADPTGTEAVDQAAPAATSAVPAQASAVGPGDAPATSAAASATVLTALTEATANAVPSTASQTAISQPGPISTEAAKPDPAGPAAEPSNTDAVKTAAAETPLVNLTAAAQPGVALPPVQVVGSKDPQVVQAGSSKEDAAAVSGLSGAGHSLPTQAGQTAVPAANANASGSPADGDASDKDSHAKNQTASLSSIGDASPAASSNATAAAFHLDTTAGVAGPAGNSSGDRTGQGQAVIQQIMNQIEPAIRSGKTSLHIQLQPESMGRIDLHMTSTDQGVSVTFRASQPGTQAALDNNLPALREALSQAGIQLSQQSLGGQQGQAGNSYADRHTNLANGYGNQKGSTGDAQPGVVEKTWKPASMVDYRV